VTLEEQLRNACEKGMTHFTMWPVHSEDRKTIYWHAQATPSTGHSYVSTNSLDPVEAVTEVLKALPRAKAERQHVAHRKSDPPDEVTAPVTEERTGSLDWENWK
jgi:hypothetical protein